MNSVLKKEKKKENKQGPIKWDGWLVDQTNLNKVDDVFIADFANPSGKLIQAFLTVNTMSALRTILKPEYRTLILSSLWCCQASSAIGQMGIGQQMNIVRAFSLVFLGYGFICGVVSGYFSLPINRKVPASVHHCPECIIFQAIVSPGYTVCLPFK